MSKQAVAMIQKAGSPQKKLLDQALGAVGQVEVFSDVGGQLATDADGRDTLVVWDLWGFEQGEITQWQQALDKAGANLVLALDRLDEPRLALLDMPGVIAFLAPDSARSLAALQIRLALELHRQINQLEAQQRRLEQETAKRGIIERAKSVLMAALDISEPEAMRRMQKHARNSNQKLVKVARVILNAQRDWE